MGKKYVLVDDLDGKELPDDTTPVRLSLGRTTYNIYLSEKNHGKLMDALTPFIENAETASSGTPASAKSATSASDKRDQKDARAWAQNTNFKFKNAAGEEKTLGDRGRIPDAVMEAWRAAGSPTSGD